MDYVAIKQEHKNGKEIFTVSAIPLKNKTKSIVQRIPHPLGTDLLEFETLEEAKQAIVLAGFTYILPNGEKEHLENLPKIQTVSTSDSYEQIILKTIKSKINSNNSTIAAAAVLTISEFPCDETFKILFEKIGDDNDLIRKNAISGICRYSDVLQPRIIKALKSSNWVSRNSALSCILNLAETNSKNIEEFIIPLTEACEDSNTIVQANALTTLAKVYQIYRKNLKI